MEAVWFKSDHHLGGLTGEILVVVCLGLTQAEVAGRIGITQAAYAQMERVKQPRKATVEKVAAALGLEVEQLRW